MSGTRTRRRNVGRATRTLRRGSWPRRTLVTIEGASGATPAVAAARRFKALAGATIDTVVQAQWPRAGGPSRRERVVSIARAAAERAAELLVLGLDKRDQVSRKTAGRMASHVARYTPVPLYAAVREDDPPRRCIVVFPDGRWHGPTLERAIMCTAPGGSAYVAVPAEIPRDGSTAVQRSAGAIALRALSAWRGVRLDDVRIEGSILRGDVLTAVLQLVEDVDAQLIAAPVYGAPGPERASLPNLAEPLLLTAPCSVLLIPDTNYRPRVET